MTYINEPIRQTMFNTLRPILEDWSGIKLDPTSSYGIRTYYNGSCKHACLQRHTFLLLTPW
jgi:hypothetical protein